MTLNDWASLATILQALFVVVSLAFIWYQMRETLRVTRAANSHRQMEILCPWQLVIAQDEKMAELWMQGARTPETLSERDLLRYHRLLMYVLNTYESGREQWKEKLIDDVTYTMTNEALKRMVTSGNFEYHWNRIKKSFKPQFAQYVDQILKKGDTLSTLS